MILHAGNALNLEQVTAQDVQKITIYSMIAQMSMELVLQNLQTHFHPAYLLHQQPFLQLWTSKL